MYHIRILSWIAFEPWHSSDNSYKPLPYRACSIPQKSSLGTFFDLLELLKVALLHLSLIKVVHQIRDLVITLTLLSFTCALTTRAGGGSSLSGGKRLVRLGKSSEVGKRVGTELVEDTGNEFSELLSLTGTVDGEGVGRKSSVNLDYFYG